MDPVTGVSSTSAPPPPPPVDNHPLDLVHTGDLSKVVDAVKAHPDQAQATYNGLLSAGRYSDARSLAEAVPGADGGKGLLARSWDEMRAAAHNPSAAVVGAGKGLVNTISDVGTMLMQGSTLQAAGETDRAAAMQSLFGKTAAAKQTQAGADALRSAAPQVRLPTLPFNTPAEAGGDKIATIATTMAGGVAVYKALGGAAAKAGLVNEAHLAELTEQGIKFTASDVIATGKTSEGKIIFLERGTAQAGLQHIVEQHGADFAKIGVAEKDIPQTVMRAVTQGKFLGYQGRGTGRPIYEIAVNGQRQRIAVTTGSNGFIVGANPAGSVK